jgi:hypothetical protein
MLRQTSLLVTLVTRIDQLPWPSEPVKRPRGHPKMYADRLMVNALVSMIIRRRYTADALLAFLEQNAPLPQQLRPLLYEHGRLPSRRTGERRLTTRPQSVPGLIGYVGRYLVTLLRPWATHGRAVACDSPALEPGGSVWHKKHREQGGIPYG